MFSSCWVSAIYYYKYEHHCSKYSKSNNGSQLRHHQPPRSHCVIIGDQRQHNEHIRIMAMFLCRRKYQMLCRLNQLWINNLTAVWKRSVSDVGACRLCGWQLPGATVSCRRSRCPQLKDCLRELQQQTTKPTETLNCQLERLRRWTSVHFLMSV